MLKMEIQFDKEKVAQYGKYTLDSMCEGIDDAILEKSLRILEKGEGYRVYADNGTNKDLGYFWKIIHALTDEDWFMDNISKWLFYDSDDGQNEEDFSIEDLKTHYQNKKGYV